jgi:hypothetical protein
MVTEVIGAGRASSIDGGCGWDGAATGSQTLPHGSRRLAMPARGVVAISSGRLTPLRSNLEPVQKRQVAVISDQVEQPPVDLRLDAQSDDGAC